MKILIVNSWYYPNMLGGAEQSTKLLADNLAEKGHTVAVYCADSKHINNISKETIGEVTVYRSNIGYETLQEELTTIGKIKSKLYDLRDSRVKSDLNSIFREFYPDIVHTNSLRGISFFIWKYCKKEKIKTCHTIRDYSLITPNGTLKNDKGLLYDLFTKFYGRKARHFSNYVDIVTAPSEFTLNELLKKNYFTSSEEKICIPNSISFNDLNFKNNINYKWETTIEKPRYLYVGRLYETKGIKQMISAFQNLPINDAELVICGTGDLDSYVEEYAKKDNRVIFKGMLTSSELSIEYEQANVLIVPSVWEEPFGRVLIEGNYYGLPVIASNRGGIPEIIDTVGGGVLYDPENIEDLTKLMYDFSNSNYVKSFYSSILDNLYKYSVEKQIESFEKIYSSTFKGVSNEY